MKNKRLAAVAGAFVLVAVLSVSAFALPLLSIGDILQVISMTDSSIYSKFSEQEWGTMTPAERAEQINFVINDQKGTSYITENSEFVNDADKSFKYYCSLVDTSSSQGMANNLGCKSWFERNGLADFGLGYYKNDGHGGAGAGGRRDTVADTLNDEFIDYVKDNPFKSDFINLVKGSDGRYISWKLVVNTDYVYNTYKDYDLCPYGFNLYLHNSEGAIIDYYVYCWGMPDTRLNSSTGGVGTFYNGYSTPKLSLTYDINNNTITSVGMSYYSYTFNSGEKRTVFKCPWDLSEPAECDNDDTIVAVGVDDNGNQIQLNINSDGVTCEGNTYNYNDDNSVTINGNTYYITVNPDDVDDDYYNKFLQQVINNYYNYYNTDSTPFDGTDILSSLKSIFTSLETFRSYCYSQLKQLTDYVFDGFNSMRSSLKTIIDTLKDILKQVKEINKSVGELTEEQEEKNKSDWADLISLFKDKVGWSTLDKSMRNIQSAFFGERAYSQSSSGEIQVQILQKNAAPLNSSMPELSITYMGQSYSLYSLVPYFGSDIEPIKQFISLFLWVGFILAVFRSIPSILGGVGSLQKNTHFMSGDGD